MALGSVLPVTLTFDGAKKDFSRLTNNVGVGTVSGTTVTTQTSGWLDLTGWQGLAIEVVMATFLGSYRIEVSNDDAVTKTRVYRLDQNNNPTVAQSNSYVINNTEGYKYLRIIGAPTASNAGTCDFFIRRFNPDVIDSIQAGYADWMARQQILLAPALRTADVTKQDFRIKGNGFTMMVNVTANVGAHGVFSIYKKDLQTGIYTLTLLDSVDITSTGMKLFTVHPAITTSANLLACQGGSEWAMDTQSVTSMNYSVTITPIA